MIVTNARLEPNRSKLASALSRLMKGQWKKKAIPLLWDGAASKQMVGQLVMRCQVDASEEAMERRT